MIRHFISLPNQCHISYSIVTHVATAITRADGPVDKFVPTRSPHALTVTADPVAQEVKDALMQTMHEQSLLADSELKPVLRQVHGLIHGKMLREIPYLPCTASSLSAIRALAKILTLASIRPAISPKASENLRELSSDLSAQLHFSLMSQANDLAMNSNELRQTVNKTTFAQVIRIRDALLRSHASIKAIPNGAIRVLTLSRLTGELKAWSAVVNDSKRASGTLLPFGIDVSALSTYSVADLQAARATAIEYKRYLGGQPNPAFELYWSILEAKLTAAIPRPKITVQFLFE